MTIYHTPLRITIPSTNINHSLQLSSEHRAILNAHNQLFVDKNYKHPNISTSLNVGRHEFRAEFLSQAFVYVITETVGDYPYPYFTEKTWKAMISSMPFMLIGAQHSLKKLKEFGFQTFESWWDEEYDNCLQVADRIKLVVLELEKLCALDYSALEKYKKEMQTIINHNRSHLSEFRNNDLKNIQMILQSGQ